MSTKVDLTLRMYVAGMPVALSADTAQEQWSFTGSIRDIDLDLAEFVDRVSQDVGAGEALPGHMLPQVEVEEIALAYSPHTQRFGLRAECRAGPTGSATTLDFFFGTATLGESSGSTDGGQGATAYVFGLDFQSRLGFGQLPVVGEFCGNVTVEELRLVYASADVPAGVVDVSDSTSTADGATTGTSGGSQPSVADSNQSQSYPKGLSLSFAIDLGDRREVVALPLSTPSQASPQEAQRSPSTSVALAAAASTEPTPSDSTRWIELERTFGPVRLQKIGAVMSGSELGLALVGSVTLGGLSVALEGLQVTFPLANPLHPRFELHGLSIAYAGGPVQISGGLLEITRPDGSVEYDGLATVQTETLRLSAIGSLRKVDGHTSLFIYAVLDYPLGGVPAFYVTGLAGGFGLNRRLNLPPVDQVSTFPLITEVMDPKDSKPQLPTDPKAAGPFITQEMEKLQQYLPSSLGEYFGCAGIRFSSFKLLDSFVVVSISFGREFELDLLGLSSLVVPSQAGSSPALAVIRLQIEASFVPSEGIVMAQGLLTKDSYLLDPGCHLTGGFAFGGWFEPNPNAGDFVVTLGGYHPNFQQPAHYPTVPRIGIDWKIGAELSLTGGFYFALTPRAIMAGGALRAIFDVDLDVGGASAKVHAWFILGADFIIFWKPFVYSADVSVEMGVDVIVHFLGTHHLSLDVGADLEIWGPPFSGHAHVQFKVIGIKIGFNVEFGSAATTPPPLEWDDADPSKSFRQSFLPADDEIVSAAVAGGLVRKVDLSNEGQSDSQAVKVVAGTGQVWYIINPTELRILTNSVIPTKVCDTTIPWADGKSGADGKTVPADFGSNTDFGIAPMSKTRSQVNNLHNIVIKRGGESAEKYFVLRPINRDVPGGLWAEQNSKDLDAPSLIENVPVGFEIVPAAPPTAGHTQAIDRSVLSYTTHVMADAWHQNTVNPFTVMVQDPGDEPAANAALWGRIQTEMHTNTVREAMLADLGFPKSAIDIGESFSSDATYAPLYGKLNPT